MIPSPILDPLANGVVAMKVLVGVLAVSVAAVAMVLTAAEKPQDDPLAQLQGTWEQTMKDPQGKTYKFVKMINGKTEICSTYEGETLVHQHTVDFDVKKTEHVTIFTFRNLVVTAGPNKGDVQKDPVSYLYQIKGDQLFYAYGLLNDDKRSPSVGICQRVKENPTEL
jgi:hypothetical protein